MSIPDKVVKRLTLYHFILDDLREDEKYISSTKIANLLNIDNSQVRKDLKYLDNSGKCRVGYEAKSLKRKIEERLGFKQTKDAFIVGAGNLGSALAKYDSFKDYGLNILAMLEKKFLIYQKSGIWHQDWALILQFLPCRENMHRALQIILQEQELSISGILRLVYLICLRMLKSGTKT